MGMGQGMRHMTTAAAVVPLIITGAGTTGAALACLCAHGGLPVELWAAPPNPASPAARRRADWVLAVNPASVRLLRQAHIWEHIPEAGRAPFRSVEVWDEEGGLLSFEHGELRRPELGWMVRGGALERALEEALGDAPGLRRRALKIKELGWEQRHLCLEAEGSSPVRARLVVAADGARSTLRGLAGIGVREHDYRQQALTCELRHTLPHGAVARQKFLAGGPLALLPTADPQCCGLVWTLPEQDAPHPANLPEARFRALLEEQSEGVLGNITETGPRSLYPLRRVMAESYFQGRLALSGDAAHFVHPLAGLGANLGLADAGLLAALLLDAHRQRRDPGDAGLLARYQRRRRLENACFAHGLDAVRRAFRLPPPLHLARRAALGWLNDRPTLKGLLAAPALETRIWPPAADPPPGITPWHPA